MFKVVNKKNFSGDFWMFIIGETYNCKIVDNRYVVYDDFIKNFIN